MRGDSRCATPGAAAMWNTGSAPPGCLTFQEKPEIIFACENSQRLNIDNLFKYFKEATQNDDSKTTKRCGPNLAHKLLLLV